MATAKKVFEVEATTRVVFYVLAADESEAGDIASECAGDALNDDFSASTYIYVEREVTPKNCPDSDLDYVPYGSDDLSIQEIFDEAAATPEPSEDTGPVHWCAGCLHERVQFDWRNDVQICPACETTEVAA